VSCVCIPITGSADVRKHGAPIGALRPGHIIGTALTLTGEPSPVEVTFTEPARYMRWSLPNLRNFMDKRPDLRVALQGLVNRDLAGKLERVLS
jgi:CRP-like cAMP-binding protein